MIASLLIGIVWMVGRDVPVGIKINYANFAAFPITFGIGVDYAVNIMARFRQERADCATDCPPIPSESSSASCCRRAAPSRSAR